MSFPINGSASKGTMTMYRILTALAAATASAATLFVAVSPAAAQPQARSIAVGYADLDLASAAGRTTLEKRIGSAAKRVCSVEHSVDLARRLAEQRCVANARSQSMTAVTQMAARAKDTQLAAAAGTITAAR